MIPLLYSQLYLQHYLMALLDIYSSLSPDARLNLNLMQFRCHILDFQY